MVHSKTLAWFSINTMVTIVSLAALTQYCYVLVWNILLRYDAVQTHASVFTSVSYDLKSDVDIGVECYADYSVHDLAPSIQHYLISTLQIWIWTLERIVDTYLQARINSQWIWSGDGTLIVILLTSLLGGIVHSGNCLSSVDVQLLLSGGLPGTTVHLVHGGSLIIIMQ